MVGAPPFIISKQMMMLIPGTTLMPIKALNSFKTIGTEGHVVVFLIGVRSPGRCGRCGIVLPVM